MSDHAFICYARDDQEFVLEFAKNLRERGASIWIDQFDIPVSTDWDTAIDDALYECSTFIIVLSPQSVKSKEVRAELRTALDEDIKILPVIYQECRLPRQLRLVQYVDFTGCSPSDDEKLGLVLSALGVEEAQEDETPVQTDEHDKKGASLSNNHPNREIYNALTRIYGITLGETTEDEFCDVVEGIDGEFEHDYTIGDETTYKGSGTQLGADISFKNKIAFKWRISFGSWNWDMPKSLADLGFTWDLSYRSWISLLERLEFDVEVVKKPKRQEVKKIYWKEIGPR